MLDQVQAGRVLETADLLCPAEEVERALRGDPQMNAAVAALSDGKVKLDVKLCQLVKLMRNGEPVKMSKRAGDFVTLREVVEEVGSDATRFMMLFRKNDAVLDFDLAKVIEQSKDNPLFYVQYAHARISSILQQWGGKLADFTNADLSLLQSKASDHLLRRLAEYPEVLTNAAVELAPHALAFYLRDLAGDFHTFYNADRVLVDDEPLKLARLALLSATRQVLQNGLRVLGVSAPAKM